MADILISIASKIAEYLVEPIVRPFVYLIDFDKNIEDLRKQVEKLESMKLKVKQLTEAAQMNAEDIEPEVQRWLLRVDEVIEEVGKLEDEIKLKERCCNGCCPNIIFLCCTSKESTKKVAVVTSLQEEGKFNRLSRPPPPTSIEFLSSGDFIVFESTKSMMNQIMDALKNDEINIVGVYGMRGVGKTALVKEVGKKAKELKVFDEVVVGVVSETPNLREIQSQIADMLGLKLNEESEMGRSRRLYTRMKNEKILIILDDIWARLDLEALGIPLDQKGWKVLLTTRREHVCNAIGSSTKKIQLNALSEDESWTLFSRTTGAILDSPIFNAAAREVARECRGLPLMLLTIGRRLREKNLEEWKDVVEQLKKSRATKKGKVDQDDFVYEYDD